MIVGNEQKYTHKEYEHIEHQTEEATDRLSNMQSEDGALHNEANSQYCRSQRHPTK